ncbi:uncharacterized protein LOC111050699 isoform X5 [Nilaparvata lugens]|uniref:uncharacterized protein LOC111050699 isoform X5 n=1 Tax=Nilaparvata lugens TaxID=108931 RepID=UPI00193DEA49|nr:uncharacterized protein LOC111050699 isoform X5 [Nilaparvata lugens]
MNFEEMDRFASISKLLFMLLALQIIFLSQSCVEGIKCYQCNSMTHPECINLEKNDTDSFHYRECEEEKVSEKQIFCRKIVQKILDRNGLVRVVRKCGWVKHPRLECYSANNKDHEETVCQCFQDGCNSATSITASAGVILLQLAAIALTAFRCLS